jgi:hypothetical protein
MCEDTRPITAVSNAMSSAKPRPPRMSGMKSVGRMK